MSNNYLQFSTSCLLNDVFAVADVLQALDQIDDGANFDDLAPSVCLDRKFVDSLIDDGYFARLEIDSEAGRLLVYSDESGNIETTAELLQKMLAAGMIAGDFRNNSILISWAETSSAMRCDEFGGGSVLITATTIYWQENSAKWAENLLDTFSA